MSMVSPNPSPAEPTEATVLLRRMRDGDERAAEILLPLVYEQLRVIAGSYFRSQGEGHTLQPTALLHEAYLKLVRDPNGRWENREHFCAVAARAMRQILWNHARDRQAEKRGGGAKRVVLTTIAMPSTGEGVDLVALDEALSRLAAVDERGARIVELRFFGGLTNEQIADLLEISTPTVERSWRRSRAWLRARLGEPEESEE